MSEWIRFGFAAVFIAGGLTVMCIGVFGLFKFDYVLNRMHAAALVDTLALLLVIIGLIIINGFEFVSLKLVLVLVFFWMTTPVSGHLISQLEEKTNEHIKNHCEIGKDGELK